MKPFGGVSKKNYAVKHNLIPILKNSPPVLPFLKKNFHFFAFFETKRKIYRLSTLILGQNSVH